jgi:hypothetical protein
MAASLRSDLTSIPGLPDIFKPKIPIWVVLEGLEMEDVGIYILWPFCILSSYLEYFSRFGMLYQEKIWQPCSILSQFG